MLSPVAQQLAAGSCVNEEDVRMQHLITPAGASCL
jgi:hypothetical protein